MIRCDKCNATANETDAVVWKCNACAKMFKVQKVQVQKFSEKKKQYPTATLLKCKSCGNALDDGKESLFWKCSCGNIARYKLSDFEGQALMQINGNLIRCPECGEYLPNDSLFCTKCGVRIDGTLDSATHNTSDVFVKNKKIFRYVVISLVVLVLVLIIVNAVQASNLKKELQRDWYKVEGDDGASILCVLDFSDNEVEYRLETGYAWIDTTVATYDYRVISRNKIMVLRYSDEWEIMTIKFNNDKSVMTVTPALTNIEDEETWVNID